jgi:sulfatase maturation enzyme AslB (radical SAM superfamily)
LTPHGNGIMYQHAEIVHWMKNRDTHKIIPAQVDIDLTNICNQDCFYCNSADHRKASPVQKQYQSYIKLLDQLATWREHSPKSFGSLHTITYPGGGEPTLLPGYERVIEHTIDLGFLTSITTNGTRLEHLIENVPANKLNRMAWVGIDIDAGTEELYEIIRRSIPKKSPFGQVMRNAKDLVALGVNVDFKVLINQYNNNRSALEQIFQRSREVGVRLLYFRPAIINGQAYPWGNNEWEMLYELSDKYNVELKLNTSKTEKRNYTRCHQMYQFPVFCADGYIYTCCDNKGNHNFALGRWDEGDFRDLWLNDRHHSMYNTTNTQLCPPCRPNANNIQIQKIINDNSLLETLYT